MESIVVIQGVLPTSWPLVWSVFRIRDIYPGSEFFPSGFRIRIKEFAYFKPTKLFLSSRKHDPGCSSRILIFLPIPDPGSRGQKGTGSATLDIVLFTDLLVLTVLWRAGVAWLRPCWLLQVGGHQLAVQRWLDFQLLATATNMNYFAVRTWPECANMCKSLIRTGQDRIKQCSESAQKSLNPKNSSETWTEKIYTGPWA